MQGACILHEAFLKCRLKDPLPYMAKYPEADILTSSDHLVRRHVLPGLKFVLVGGARNFVRHRDPATEQSITTSIACLPLPVT